ncbi:hypothetical protein H4R35_001700 [Dimargaris xerosporica]|nr:hypothetical protein H4R35_001700 [Dimargaris xerosporica]
MCKPTRSVGLFLQQPNKLINGQGLCFSISGGDVYAGAELKAEKCDARHPEWQVFKSIPYPHEYNGEYSVIQSDSHCIQSPTRRQLRRGINVVTIRECNFESPQLYEWLPLDEDQKGFQLKNRETGMCIGANDNGQALMKECANALDQRWELSPIGGSFCDDQVWAEFQQGLWSVGQLMDRVGVNSAQYYNTIRNQGVPSLTMADENLLLNCDINIQSYFKDFARHNHNMYSKLLAYPGTYNTQVIIATQNSVYMFLDSKLANQVWKSLKPLADNFLTQFAGFLTIQYPQYGWLINIGRKVISEGMERIDNGNPPELYDWGTRVQEIFNDSVRLIWAMHVELIANEEHARYDEYAQIYQDKTLQEIFGSEEKIRAQITVMLSKLITQTPAMAPHCCVTRYLYDLGRSDYKSPHSKEYYRLILPGQSRDLLLSPPLNEFAKLEDMVLGQDGWKLRQVSTFSSYGTCGMPL